MKAFPPTDFFPDFAVRVHAGILEGMVGDLRSDLAALQDPDSVFRKHQIEHLRRLFSARYDMAVQSGIMFDEWKGQIAEDNRDVLISCIAMNRQVQGLLKQLIAGCGERLPTASDEPRRPRTKDPISGLPALLEAVEDDLGVEREALEEFKELAGQKQVELTLLAIEDEEETTRDSLDLVEVRAEQLALWREGGLLSAPEKERLNKAERLNTELRGVLHEQQEVLKTIRGKTLDALVLTLMVPPKATQS